MCFEYTAPRAESKAKYRYPCLAFWQPKDPPCLEFSRVPECIFEGFLCANDIGDQSIFDDFMDGLEERWRLELMAITREAVNVLMARRARSAAPSHPIRGNGSGKRKPGSHWRALMEDVPEGGRDNALTSVAGMLLRNPNVPPDQRLPLLRQFNERHCKPPVSEADIRRIAGVFRRYK
jgi:hypothetical protein